MREKMSQKTVPWLNLTFNSWSWILLTQPDGNEMARLTPTIHNKSLTMHSQLLSQVLKGLQLSVQAKVSSLAGSGRESCATCVDIVQLWISRVYLCNVFEHYFSRLWCWLQPLLKLFTNKHHRYYIRKYKYSKLLKCNKYFFNISQPFRYHIFLFNSAVE